MSEWVTWESCPSCGEQAAVGWADERVAEVDCVSGCELTAYQMAEAGHGVVPARAGDSARDV
jgi:Zn ribbon nucleic-acid-binding protein